MKILFITHLTEGKKVNNDFLHDSILHGLRENHGSNVIDYPGAWYMYESEVKKRNFDVKNLWGKGFTFYDLLAHYEKIDRTDIQNKILTN